MTNCKTFTLLLLVMIIGGGCAAPERTSRIPAVPNLPPREKVLEEYRKADAKIAKIWQQEGQHALLHHLNAIFGYKPLTIRKNLTF